MSLFSWFLAGFQARRCWRHCAGAGDLNMWLWCGPRCSLSVWASARLRSPLRGSRGWLAAGAWGVPRAGSGIHQRRGRAAGGGARPAGGHALPCPGLLTPPSLRGCGWPGPWPALAHRVEDTGEQVAGRGGLGVARCHGHVRNHFANPPALTQRGRVPLRVGGGLEQGGEGQELGGYGGCKSASLVVVSSLVVRPVIVTGQTNHLRQNHWSKTMPERRPNPAAPTVLVRHV